MTNVPSSDIPVLDFLGEKYLEWKVGVETYLTANGLEDTISEHCIRTADKAKAMIFLRRHIHESLRYEFILIDEPKDLWRSLNKRYGSKKSYLYKKTLDNWINIRFEDYESVSDYNCALSRITSILALYGEKITEEDKLRKTYSTMHHSNKSVQQECIAAGYTNHTDLVSVLIVLEKCCKLIFRKRKGFTTHGSE